MKWVKSNLKNNKEKLELIDGMFFRAVIVGSQDKWEGTAFIDNRVVWFYRTTDKYELIRIVRNVLSALSDDLKEMLSSFDEEYEAMHEKERQEKDPEGFQEDNQHL